MIIPHYNDLANLSRCLALLFEQTVPRNRVEVIVADNNSRCGIAAVEAAAKGRARVIHAPIQGAAEARNAGVAASHAHALAFIDSDCRPSPNWLEQGVQALARADMVGGRVDVDVRDPRHPSPEEAFEIVFAFNFKRYVEREHFSGSGNMFVSRAIFDKVGGFRSGVAEDRDWGHRAVALGYRWLYAGNAQVSHPARSDWPDLVRKWRRLVKESYSAMREKPLGNIRWILRSWLVLISPFAHVFLVLRTPKLEGVGMRLQVIGVLFRIRWWRFRESHRVLLAKNTQ